MNNIPDEMLVNHHVLFDTFNPFQRRARRLQALWREERGLFEKIFCSRPVPRP